METSRIYHVFNHANGVEDIFRETRNYHHFMNRYYELVTPAIDLHAFCLMPNHFHLALGIPATAELAARDDIFSGLSDDEAAKKIAKQFSNLFSSYTQSFNKIYGRMGSMFRPNMRWKPVDDEAGFCKLVHYIHCNPVHHGFVKDLEDWPHCSFPYYKSMAKSERPDNAVLKAFGGYDAFMRYHGQPIQLKLPDLSEERIMMKLQFEKKKMIPKSMTP
jgi:REP element-mobilizing transposase RayT